MKVLVTGASGYIGRTLVERLEADGHEVVPFSRHGGGDITDPAAIERAAQGADAIAHLVAILDGSDEQLEAVNARGPANAVAAARAAGVRRFLHMSALGVTAEHAPLAGYWRTKWAGMQAVTGSDLDWTVFEPSFVFARAGGAFAEFERLIRMPLTPVIGDGRYRHQPVWAGDVAAAFCRRSRGRRRSASATSWAVRRPSSSTICSTRSPASPAGGRIRRCTFPPD